MLYDLVLKHNDFHQVVKKFDVIKIMVGVVILLDLHSGFLDFRKDILPFLIIYLSVHEMHLVFSI